MEHSQKGYEKPELFFGLVGPLGADLDSLTRFLENSLCDVGYDVKMLRLSDLLRYIWKKPLPKRSGPLDKYIKSLQDAGDEFRKKTNRNDAFAILSIAEIRRLREAITNDPKKPAPASAYIITSLKTPEEFYLFNRIYGDAFFLIGTTRPREERKNYLAELIAKSYGEAGKGDLYLSHAEERIKRDYKDAINIYGQNVQDTFPLSSLFVDSNDLENMEDEIRRFIQIIFGYQFHTPTRDEYLMYHAHAASLRSSDLSRQVGAAIGSTCGDILAAGTNEVPKPGGGLYWPGDKGDSRDFKRGNDSNYEVKIQIISDLIQRLKSGKVISPALSRKSEKTILKELLPILKKSDFMDIGEYGRTVHAEMAALINASYRGISVKGAYLYSTTFPCHNCTKHIIAAGIEKVIYIEPYPKSKTSYLHDDAVEIDGCREQNKICFKPFVGISPRSYLKSFTKLKRKNESGEAIIWANLNAKPKILNMPDLSYIPYEEHTLSELYKIKEML